MSEKCWKRAERRVAELLGGCRVPVSGRGRGNVPDIRHPTLSVEVKSRRTIPNWLEDTLRQAEAAARDGQVPVAVLHQHGQRYEDSLVLIRLEVEVRAARRAAFAPSLQGSKDPATVWSYYRQCLDRAKKLETPNEVQEEIQSSEMIGDDLYSKALLHRAYALGDAKSVETYLASRPEENKLWDEFMDRAEEFNSFEKQHLLFGLARLRKPEEIFGKQLQA